MARGIAILTGSNSSVFQAMEDGTVTIGRDVPVTTQISGTLTLRVAGSGGTHRYARSGPNGEVTFNAITASNIDTIPLGNLTSSNVQGALNELQDSINQLSAGTTITFSDGQFSEALSSVTITGTINQVRANYNSAADTFTIGLTPNVTITNDLQVGGNLTVLGTTNNLQVTNVYVEDPLIVLASGNTGFSLDQGFIFTRGPANNQGFIWDESNSEFALISSSENGTTAGNVTIAQYSPLRLAGLNATAVTASNGATVAGGFSVTSGLTILQGVNLITLSSSANTYIGNNLTVTGNVTLGTSNIHTTTINSKFKFPIFTAGITTGTIPVEYVNTPSSFAGHAFYLQGQGSGSGDFQQGNKWYFNENGIWYPSLFFSQ